MLVMLVLYHYNLAYRQRNSSELNMLNIPQTYVNQDHTGTSTNLSEILSDMLMVNKVKQ